VYFAFGLDGPTETGSWPALYGRHQSRRERRKGPSWSSIGRTHDLNTVVMPLFRLSQFHIEGDDSGEHGAQAGSAPILLYVQVGAGHYAAAGPGEMYAFLTGKLDLTPRAPSR